MQLLQVISTVLNQGMDTHKDFNTSHKYFWLPIILLVRILIIDQWPCVFSSQLDWKCLVIPGQKHYEATHHCNFFALDWMQVQMGAAGFLGQRTKLLLLLLLRTLIFILSTFLLPPPSSSVSHVDAASVAWGGSGEKNKRGWSVLLVGQLLHFPSPPFSSLLASRSSFCSTKLFLAFFLFLDGLSLEASPPAPETRLEKFL